MDIVWWGHVHNHGRTWPILKNRAVESGGVIYVTSAGAGGSREKFAPTKTWFGQSLRNAHHYCYVSILGKTPRFQAFDLERHPFDSMEFKKP